MTQDSRGWAQEQVLPWAAAAVITAAGYAAELERLNAVTFDIFVYDFRDGEVGVREKTMRYPVAFNDRIVHLRAELYRKLLQDAADARGLRAPFSVAVAVADMPSAHPAPGMPLFGYQKLAGAPLILLPDPEFLENRFYAEEDEDVGLRLSSDPKLNQVMFSGSSTGRILTEQRVRDDDSERLRYAARFLGHPHVRFTIGFAAECETPEAEALLQAKPYFAMVDWQHQLLSRYVFSMDGNGATCSRVIRVLRSRSVLLKLASPHTLFYFSGLIPWRHYVPVADADDLDRLSHELTRPEFPAELIADAANRFCRESLGAAEVLDYAGRVLELFGRDVLARMA